MGTHSWSGPSFRAAQRSCPLICRRETASAPAVATPAVPYGAYPSGSIRLRTTELIIWCAPPVYAMSAVAWAGLKFFATASVEAPSLSAFHWAIRGVGAVSPATNSSYLPLTSPAAVCPGSMNPLVAGSSVRGLFASARYISSCGNCPSTQTCCRSSSSVKGAMFWYISAAPLPARAADLPGPLTPAAQEPRRIS